MLESAYAGPYLVDEDDGQFRQRSALIKEACTSSTVPSTLLHSLDLQLRGPPCTLPHLGTDMVRPVIQLALIRLHAVTPQSCHPVVVAQKRRCGAGCLNSIFTSSTRWPPGALMLQRSGRKDCWWTAR